MLGKRGQFYIVAGIIILFVIAGFSVLTNYVKKKTTIRLYDVKEELGIESANVLDYGTYNDYSEAEMEGLVQGFITDYEEYTGNGKNLYFIFGDTDKISVTVYQNLESGEAYIDVGGGNSELTPGTTEDFYPTAEDDMVILTVENEEYFFKLREGENFYFVIYQEVGEETHVVSN